MRADSGFLAGLGVMDYSLLVGVDKARGELVLGVIDYCRQVWGWGGSARVGGKWQTGLHPRSGPALAIFRGFGGRCLCMLPLPLPLPQHAKTLPAPPPPLPSLPSVHVGQAGGDLGEEERHPGRRGQGPHRHLAQAVLAPLQVPAAASQPRGALQTKGVADAGALLHRKVE